MPSKIRMVLMQGLHVHVGARVERRLMEYVRYNRLELPELFPTRVERVKQLWELVKPVVGVGLGELRIVRENRKVKKSVYRNIAYGRYTALGAVRKARLVRGQDAGVIRQDRQPQVANAPQGILPLAGVGVVQVHNQDWPMPPANWNR